MALHPFVPEPGDPGEPELRIGRADGSLAGAERRLLRDGAQVIAHGALVCPSCELPLSVGGAIAAASPLRCGFCSYEGAARTFLRPDVYDTVANEAYVVARVG